MAKTVKKEKTITQSTEEFERDGSGRKEHKGTCMYMGVCKITAFVDIKLYLEHIFRAQTRRFY